MLEARELRKQYGAVKAVDGVSFSVANGETVGLLGPNGAGKTTTVSMIAGLVRPDSGEVLIDGQPLRGDTDPIKRKIGLVPQDLALYEEMTAMENLRFFAALYNLDGAPAAKAIDAALDLVGLKDRAKDKTSGFSGGMKRRLNLAVALLHDPQILLLDEPTVGVDPQSRYAIFENLETLKSRGKTLIYTTHYMEEAERLCDRLIVIDHGCVIASDTLQGLYRLNPVTNILKIELKPGHNGSPGRNSLEAGLKNLSEVESAALHDDTLRAGLRNLSTGAPLVLNWLATHGYPYDHVESERPDLETVFLSLTGRSLRDS